MVFLMIVTNKSVKGHEFTGTVEAVGEGVKSIKVGDRIVTTFSAVW